MNRRTKVINEQFLKDQIQFQTLAEHGQRSAVLKIQLVRILVDMSFELMDSFSSFTSSRCLIESSVRSPSVGHL